MRRVPSFTAAVALVVVTTVAAPAGATRPGKEVPFTATLGGDQVLIDPFADVATRCEEVDPEVVDFVTTFEGTGHATHLGLVDVWAQHCTDLDTGRYGDGLLRLTAANGDVLWGTYGNGLTRPADPTDPAPTLFVFDDEFRFVDGGSGRFAFADGGGVEQGDFDVLSNAWSIEMRGSLGYRR